MGAKRRRQEADTGFCDGWLAGKPSQARICQAPVPGLPFLVGPRVNHSAHGQGGMMASVLPSSASRSGCACTSSRLARPLSPDLISITLIGDPLYRG